MTISNQSQKHLTDLLTYYTDFSVHKLREILHRMTPLFTNLQKLLTDWLLKTHMLSTLDGEPICDIVVDHFRDGGEGFAELSQNIPTISNALYFHVHEPSGAPEEKLRLETLFFLYKFVLATEKL